MLTLKVIVTAGILFIVWTLPGNAQKPASGVILYSYVLQAAVPNNTFFSQNNVGGSFTSSLDCFTANGANSIGNWYNPSGIVLATGYSSPYYTLRNPSRISLFRTGGGWEGVFTCRIPDENGVMQTLYVGIYAPATIQSSHGPVFVPPVVFQLLTDLSQSPPGFSLAVNSTSSPPTTVVWTRNALPPTSSSQSLVLTDGVSANYTSTLVVVGAGLGGVYQCNVSNAAGTNTVSFTVTAQSPPTNLQVTQLGGGSVLVSWTSPGSPFPDGYLLQYVGNGSANSTLLQGTSLQYTVQGLVDRANYTVRVLSYCGICIPSVWSAVSFTVTDPDPPSNVVATPISTTSVLVMWQAPRNMSVFMYGFVVRYMPNTPCGEIPGGSGPPTNETSQLVGGLQEGTEYTFSVGLKFTYGGVGQWSLGAMATTYPDVPTGPPLGVVALSSPGSSTIQVTWDPPSCLSQNGPITSYEVQFNSTLPSSSTNQTSLTVSVPRLFTTYMVRVAAVNANGTGPFSYYYPVDVVGVPGNVKSLSVVPNIVSVNILWSPPDIGGGWVTEYEIRNSWGSVAAVPYTNHGYKMGGLQPSAMYAFEVRAVTTAGAGGWTAIVTTTLAIGKVQNIKITNINSSTVHITWDSLGSTDISFYNVSYVLPTSPQTSILVLGNTSSAIVGGLLAGEQYQFTVSAVVLVNGTALAGEGRSYMFAIVTDVSPSVLALVVGVVVGTAIGAVCVALVIVLIMYSVRRYKNSGNMDVASHDALELVKPPLHLPLPVFDEPYHQHKVASSKPTIEDNPKDKIAEVGEQVVFQPRVSGNPEPTIAWYHDGAMVTSDYSLELDERGKLTIVSVELKHAGVYRYTVSNNLGSVQGQVSLFVLGEKGGLQTDGTLTFQPQTIQSVPVPLSEFGQYVEDLHISGNKGFREQFSRLDSGEFGRSVLEGLLPQNKAKNRFLNIVVYDDNRIELKPLKGSSEEYQDGYINASYIDGYSSPRKYVATQGPLATTVVDFWRLVWQCHVPSIVMITNLKEGGKVKCERYWPEEGSCEYGPFRVTMSNQLVYPDYTTRTLQVSTATKSHKVTHYHFTSWPDHGVPEYATGLLSFHHRVMKEHKSERGPILVHCSAGVGRSGTFITVDMALEQARSAQIIDIPNIVIGLRCQRMKMVQNEEQYLFVHDAILEALMCGDTQIPATNLAERLHKLSEWNPTYEQTSFEHQFFVLQQLSSKYTDNVCNTAQQNPDKNRTSKNLPLEKYRVILKGGHPDYINASYVNGYKKKKAFIISQGPLPHTCKDFWKMVYERDCAVIVMLSGINERGEEVCTRYWPSSGMEQFGLCTVTQLQETMHEGFLERIFGVSNGSESDLHRVTQFQVLNWSPDGLSVNPRAIVNAMNCIIHEQRRTGNGPIVVHCSDTVSRSGVFCATMSAIEGCKAEGVIDVFQIVKGLRTQKPNTVANVDQYKFIHELVLTFVETYSNYSNFK